MSLMLVDFVFVSWFLFYFFLFLLCFFFKQKTAYEMRISDWSSDVCSSDLRRVLSGILFVIRNGLRWRDAPSGYGPHKTIYNRFIRWSRLGVFNRILTELAGQSGGSDQLMIDTTQIGRAYV